MVTTRQRKRQRPMQRDPRPMANKPPSRPSGSMSPRRMNSKKASKRPAIFATLPLLEPDRLDDKSLAILCGEVVGQLWQSVAVLTATLMQSCLFQTGSIASPASRFICEHLHQNLFWACISRIHAQVPLVPFSTFPLRQPARNVIAGERQTALPVRRGANLKRRVPEPPVSAEPAIPQTALSPVRVAANPIASRDSSHGLF